MVVVDVVGAATTTGRHLSHTRHIRYVGDVDITAFVTDVIA
jgi:hypothetical protein